MMRFFTVGVSAVTVEAMWIGLGIEASVRCGERNKLKAKRKLLTRG